METRIGHDGRVRGDALETFLVEWKLPKNRRGGEVFATLKPS